MARPAKSIKSQTGHITNAEEELRLLTEARVKGGSEKLVAPEELTDKQKEIFNYILSELKASEILGNLDIYVLKYAAIVMDRMDYMEQEISKDPTLLFDTKFMGTKDKYSKDFFRCCNELSLSPQARAKLSISNVNALKENRNPLIDALDI